MNDNQLKELRERNQARVQQVIEQMGPKWLLHPSNRVQRGTKGNHQFRSAIGGAR